MPSTPGPVTPGPDTPWRRGTLTRTGSARMLFGWSYEDERIELDAFGPPGRVCVIAAAGETAAACAAAGHHVTAVDINPVQLDYCAARLAGDPVRTGVAERGLALGRTLLGSVDPAWRPDRIARALATGVPGDELWARLDTRRLALLLAAFVRPGGVVGRLLPTGFGRLLPARFDRIIRARLGRALRRHRPGDHRFAWRLLTGREAPGWRLPRPAGGGRVDLVAGDIVAHLRGVPAGHYAGIALSNVTDGASADFARDLSAAARHALRPGGAIVRRTFAEAIPEPPLHDRTVDDASGLWGVVGVDRPR